MSKKPLDNTSRSRWAKHSVVISNPELVFGIVGPIGVDIEAVIDALTEALKDVGYTPIQIHLTELIRDKRIASAESLIGRQLSLLGQLEREGHDIETAQSLLDTMRQSLQQMHVHRQIIEGEPEAG